MSGPIDRDDMEQGRQLLELIRSRRSVRRFADAPVPDELVDEVISAAITAPSACNEQPWHFVVVRDRQILQELSRRHPFGGPVKAAPLCVVPTVDLNVVTTLFAGDFWIQDMSAATENLLLAARALGLGAVWIGTYPARDRVEAVQAVLQMPETAVPLCLVPMGYALDTPEPRAPNSAGRIHRDIW